MACLVEDPCVNDFQLPKHRKTEASAERLLEGKHGDVFNEHHCTRRLEIGQFLSSPRKVLHSQVAYGMPPTDRFCYSKFAVEKHVADFGLSPSCL